MERQKERAAEKERLRQQQLEERDRREREAIAAANLSQEEKERLMKEHEKNIKKLQVGDLLLCVCAVSYTHLTLPTSLRV